MRVILPGMHSIWRGWRVTSVAPRIANDVSYVTRIYHESHFEWQAQYLMTPAVTSVAARIVLDVSYVTRINHECYCVVRSSTGVLLYYFVVRNSTS